MELLIHNKQNIKKLEDYITKYFPSIKNSDFMTLVDIIYMTIIRLNINTETLLGDLYNGILDLNKFRNENDGNIYDFIRPEYVQFAQRIKDINIGSNGGMANVGKGEWLISFCSGINSKSEESFVSIIKKGRGDYEFNDNKKSEELKWNGGKVSTERSGLEVTRIFNDLINIDDKHWVPFRINDRKKYSEDIIKTYNAMYWKAISGETNISLTDNELKQKIISMAFNNTFKKCDTFIMFNNDGKFHRFHSSTEANKYYEDKYERLIGMKGFECRSKQKNPIALYCQVF
tara:strand:- start:2066 stop:2929 length:864 start_codon:yes stop_codon:yes gene_type:complete